MLEVAGSASLCESGAPPWPGTSQRVLQSDPDEADSSRPRGAYGRVTAAVYRHATAQGSDRLLWMRDIPAEGAFILTSFI